MDVATRGGGKKTSMAAILSLQTPRSVQSHSDLITEIGHRHATNRNDSVPSDNTDGRANDGNIIS